MSLLYKTITNKKYPYFISLGVLFSLVVFQLISNNIYGTKIEIATVNVLQPAQQVAVLGDIACDSLEYAQSVKIKNNECRHYEVLASIATSQIKNVLLLGDLQYAVGDQTAFTNNFIDAWNKAGLASVNAYSVLGNHEYGKKNANDYFSSLRNTKIYTGEDDQGYYTFTIGEWQFIALNSNCEYVQGRDGSSSQYQWLKAVIQKPTSNCVAVLWHHPLFTSGKYISDTQSRNRMKEIWGLLEVSGIDIVLNGHDHVYERFTTLTSKGEANSEAPRQFTVGTGGRSLYAVGSERVRGSEVLISEYGYLKLNLAKNSYGWHYINMNNKVLDSGKKTCNE